MQDPVERAQDPDQHVDQSVKRTERARPRDNDERLIEPAGKRRVVGAFKTSRHLGPRDRPPGNSHLPFRPSSNPVVSMLTRTCRVCGSDAGLSASPVTFAMYCGSGALPENGIGRNSASK